MAEERKTFLLSKTTNRAINMKLVFLLLNKIAELQHLDHGMIRYFKLEHRWYVLQSIVAQMDISANASELAEKINVAYAVNGISAFWKFWIWVYSSRAVVWNLAIWKQFLPF